MNRFRATILPPRGEGVPDVSRLAYLHYLQVASICSIEAIQ